MSNRAVLDVYNSLHQATHPKPTHHSSPKGEETRRAWWALGRGKTPPRTTTTAPGTPLTIYTRSRTPTGRPAAWARGLREQSATRPSPPDAPGPRPRAGSPSPRRCPGRPPATAGLARVAVRAGRLAPGARLRAPHENGRPGPSPPGDSTQESGGGGGASQGPGPSGLAPAPPARACQGARGLPLPTASRTARRAGRKAGRTGPQAPSRLSGPWLPSGAPTPPSSSLALLPPPPERRRCPTAAPLNPRQAAARRPRESGSRSRGGAGRWTRAPGGDHGGGGAPGCRPRGWVGGGHRAGPPALLPSPCERTAILSSPLQAFRGFLRAVVLGRGPRGQPRHCP